MTQRGRPTLYRPEYPDLARRLCLLGGTNEELATFFEVSRSTIDEWLRVHPEFAEAESLARWYNRPVPAPLEERSLAAPASPKPSAVDAVAHAGEPQAPRRPGQKGHQRATARAYIKEAFPGGVPPSVSVSAIEAALKARGTPVSARTIRRARGGPARA